MAPAQGEQPWGEQGEEGMARSSLHCSWSREVCGSRMGGEEVGWWCSWWEEELERRMGKGQKQ